LIVIPPYYKNGTNDGISGSQHRKDGCHDRCQPSKNECLVRKKMKTWRKEMTACQEATEASLESKEPTSVEIQPVVVHEEVPKAQAAVKTVRALKRRYGDWHLAVGCS
jgi:hypothetical protein